MALRALLPALIVVLLLAGCDPTKKGPPAIGEAFVGPASLNLRQELAPKSTVVAVLKHGDKLDVLSTRRRFVRVRTSSGAMGWTDSRQLLSTAQMQDLRSLNEFAATLPSQGAATVFDALNIHTEPNRVAPSFAQIPENGSIDIIGHRIAAKVAPPPPVLAAPQAKPAAPKREKKPKEARSAVPPPPMPKAPRLPDNWLELSRVSTPEPGAEEEFAREANAEQSKSAAREKDEPSDKPPVPVEDWSMVRTKDGHTGWVLSRLLSMSIPDEVAQYAEGHRITSYFDLGTVKDGDQVKHIWLWTTINRGGQPFEFDGVRVFIWNTRRHRYETAYRERDITGFYPVEAAKGKGDRGDGATFSIIQQRDGQYFKRRYNFNGYRVSSAGTEVLQPSADPSSTARTVSASGLPMLVPSETPAPPGMFDQLKAKAKSILKR